MNLGRYISRSAQFWPTDTALIHRNRRFTYRELDNRTNQLAQGLLSMGLKPGDAVAIQSWNRSELVEAEVAFYKAGLIKVPVSDRLSIVDPIHVVNDSEAKVMILGPDHIEAVQRVRKDLPAIKCLICLDQAHDATESYETLLTRSAGTNPDVEVSENDLAVLHYTSGTSGKVKAAMQTFGNRLALIRKSLMTPDTRIERGDIFALVGPITHATGMNIMPVFFAGGCNLVMDRFDPDVLLETIQKQKVTHLFLVPTMIHVMLDHPEIRRFDLRSLKRLIYGAAPMSPSRIREAMAVFGPVLIQGYGAGETTSLVTLLTMKDHLEALRSRPERLASCGRPLFDTEVRLAAENGREPPVGEIGEIIVKGPDVMKGYWREPGLTQEVLMDGWYYTGDLARMDEKGYLYIVDRKKDMIISGGFNVYTSEVEGALYSHPAVHEACVIGIPDDKWGEAIKGVVVLKIGKSAGEQELIEHCRRTLSSYKKPQSIDFVDALPKSPNGKIVRRLVKETYWKGKERGVN